MGNIGNVYASLGDYSKSNEYMYRAMAIAGKLSSDKLLGSCYVNLGDNYYRMADFYKQHGRVDSSYRYLNYLIAAKDSLFNEEKTRQIQALSFEETERQQKLEEAKVEAAEERSHNVQYAVMAVGVICFLEAGCCEACGGGAGKGGGGVNKNKAKGKLKKYSW